MTKVTIKNKRGTSRHPTKDGVSWKKYWEENSHLSWPSKCQCCLKEPATLGGHVFIVSTTSKEYIVPMCSLCNAKNEEFRNVDKDYLVPANP